MPALRAFASIAAAAALAGCNLAPTYAPPTIATPASYKELGPWTPAAPADTAPRGDWWTAFGDATLSDLEQRIETDNPDLAASVARYDQARALAAQARSAQVPEVDFSGYDTHNRESAARPLRGPGSNYYNDHLVGVTVSYEFDLWGRVRNLVAAGKAQAQAAGADTASVRLSLQADLAEDYFKLRGLDAEAKLLADTSQAYARALQLTKIQHEAGSVSGLDVGRAKTQLETARAQQVDVGAQRALLEHAIASLVGTPASSFSLPAVAQLTEPPPLPVAAPSVLLQRRPDVGAAERRAFAANAGIGVARAAYYPTISLDASGGLETNSGSVNLLNVANSWWTLGPAAAMTIFDGGKRRAGVELARAQFAEASQSYRSTVLAAFQQVEDNLALCNKLADEAQRQSQAVDAAQRTETLSMIQYRTGSITYLDVVVAQTAELDAQRAALSVATRRLEASVDLVRSLGGSWRDAG